jgi:hypothetical protein
VTRQEVHHRSAAPQRKKLVFGWIQDVSTSMEGRQLDTSLKGFDFVFNEICEPSDFLSVVTFSDEVTVLHQPMPVHKISAEKDKQNIRKNLGGCTACYDAVASSILSLQDMTKLDSYKAITQDAVYELLLLTDGADNSSTKYSLQQLTDLVARPGIPNFHIVVIAVSMAGSDKAKLKELCEPVHATFIDIKNISELQNTLRRVGESVQQRLVVTTTVTETRTIQGARSYGGRQQDVSVATITNGLGSTRLALPPPPPQVAKGSKKQVVCSFFNQPLGCRNGNRCKFLHTKL